MMNYMAAVIFAALFLAACKPEAPAADDATPAQAAAQSDAHDSHASADHAEMPAKPATLWATDEPLRKGMDGMARVVTVAESAKSHGAFGEAEAKILSSEIQIQFDYMVANCKLAPEADVALHTLAGQLMQASDALQKNPTDAAAFEKLHQVLNEYPQYFDHPGWK